MPRSAALRVTETEAQFQKRVTDAAELFGWAWMHIVRCPTNRGTSWRTPTIGPLGAGWPDLVLVKGPDLLFVELKGEKGTVSPAQALSLSVLNSVGVCYVWRPDDWDRIMEVLSA